MPPPLADRVLRLPTAIVGQAGAPDCAQSLPSFWRAVTGLALLCARQGKTIVLHGLEEPLAGLEQACGEALDAFLLWLGSSGARLVSTSPGGTAALRSIYVERYLERDGDGPLLSIVMPVFNGERHVEETIDSVLRQSLSDFELLCIDDGSSDRTPALLAAKARQDPRVVVVRQDNAGTSAARNRGLDLARGRYVSFVDADDLLTPRSLERRVGLLEAGDAKICGGQVEMIDGAGAALNVTAGRRRTAWYRHCWRMPFAIATVMGESLVMKRSRFPPGVRFGEDWAYLNALLRSGWPIASCGEPSLAHYRWHACSTTGRSLKALVDGCLEVLEDLSHAEPAPICHSDRPAGALTLDDERLRRAKRKWLEWQFVASVLGDDEALRVRAVEDLNADTCRHARARSGRFFDYIAVRVLLLPQGSQALDAALTTHMDLAFAQLAALRGSRCNAAFSIALRRYLIAAERRQRARGAAGQPLHRQRIRLAADRLGFALLQGPPRLARKCLAMGRRIPGTSGSPRRSR